MLNMKDSTLKILMAVSTKTGLGDYRLILGSCKSKDLVRPRRIAMYVLRQMGLSYPAIGKELNKNHATCIFACRAVQANPEWLKIANELIDTTEFKDIVSGLSTEQVRLVEQKGGNYVDKGKWRKVFKTYKAICQVCGWEDIVEVHHRIPIKNGGNNEPINLLILCPIHHRMLHMGMLNIKKIDPPELLVHTKF